MKVEVVSEVRELLLALIVGKAATLGPAATLEEPEAIEEPPFIGVIVVIVVSK